MINYKVSDEQVMIKVKNGQLSELSTLFERHHRKLYNFFLRLTNDGSLSEDMVQNVFERIIKYRKTFRGDALFRSWMYQIARNVRTDHYRLNKVKIDDEIEPTSLNLATRTSHELLEKKERKKELERAIQKLKPEYREVLWLGWFEKMNYADVGEILGLTESNVKVRMHRAVKQLKKHFDKNSHQ